MRAVLLILDGAGLAEPSPANAVRADTMPFLFSIMRRSGFATLQASGEAVGLEPEQVGNSEVGHVAIGAGRVIGSGLRRIDAAFRDGSWKAHPAWGILARQPRVHVVGLLSEAGVHGHWRSLVQAAILSAANGVTEIVVHPILDGVDSAAGTAPRLLDDLRERLAHLPNVKLGVVMGRRWFCDRSGDLGITRVFAKAITGQGPLPIYNDDMLGQYLASESEAGFPAHAYSESDFVTPGEPVLLTSHRSDRAIQSAAMLAATQEVFSLVELGNVVEKGRVFFPTAPLDAGLAFELRAHDVVSVRISEQCKFPHVTYFLNGFNNFQEERSFCIPSLPEAEFSNHTEMSIDAVRQAVLSSLEDPENQVIIANIPNLDQVAHLGRIDLCISAAHHVDRTLQSIATACGTLGWTLLVTSDHGNADRMVTPQGGADGGHTENPVPFTVLPAPGSKFAWSAREGALANIAATLLTVIGLPRPPWMAPSLLTPSS
jgi:2,3-bisphosphoglycerate-independent phosphoglycerate mutase